LRPHFQIIEWRVLDGLAANERAIPLEEFTGRSARATPATDDDGRPWDDGITDLPFDR
jgi:hypothetical protein